MLEPYVVDPGFEAWSQQQMHHQLIPKPKADSDRLWAKYFSPMGQGGVSIPAEWMDFITVKLIQPKNFEWTRSLVTSKAWNILISDSTADTSYTYSIPAKCPEEMQIGCSHALNPRKSTVVIEELTDTSQDSGHTEDQEMGTPAKGKEPILVDTDLRCSDRLKGHRK